MPFVYAAIIAVQAQSQVIFRPLLSYLYLKYCYIVTCSIAILSNVLCSSIQLTIGRDCSIRERDCSSTSSRYDKLAIELYLEFDNSPDQKSLYCRNSILYCSQAIKHLRVLQINRLLGSRLEVE